jgi:abortive infection bacteriophage resistance protein
VLSKEKGDFSVDERIADLRNRGLEITDEPVARVFLERIGQYRLKQYWYPLFDQSVEVDGRKLFKPGASFQEVIDLYQMDRELRWLFSGPLETIELNLRSSIAAVLQRRGVPFAIYEPGFLRDNNGRPRRKVLHEATLKHKDNYKFLEIYEKNNYPELGRMDAEQKKLYLTDEIKYPIGLMVEAISFSDLSLMFDNIDDLEIRKEITGRFPLWDEYAMRKFVHRVSVLRNAVAHHARVWNKLSDINGRLPYFMWDHYPLKVDFRQYQAASVFDILTLCLEITGNLDSDGWWAQEVHNFVSRQPKWVLAQMGFPGNWMDFPHWQPLRYE